MHIQPSLPLQPLHTHIESNLPAFDFNLSLNHIPSSPTMPATTKRVHFDIPPSPALSNASLASSPGPTTPPHLQYAQQLPQKQPFVPDSPASFASFSSFDSLSYAASQVRIHPALVAPHTTLAWDMLAPPSSLPLAPALLAEAATHPALPALTLICDILPWSIAIAPAPGRAVVSVGDVLHSLYRILRLSVSQVELAYLHPDAQQRVHAAFHARYRLIRDEWQRQEERAKGVKRVDFLMDARRFAGLSIVVGGPALNGRGLGSVWSLHLAQA